MRVCIINDDGPPAGGVRAAIELPSQEVLRALLDYDPGTGALTWRERGVDGFASARSHASWSAKHVGKAVIGTNLTGYRRVKIDGRHVLMHRLIWKLVHGIDPDGEIDHINGNRCDNRLENLRVVTKRENMRNSGVKASNTTGVVGVYWYKKYQCWLVKIGRDHVGYYDCFNEAALARKAAAQRENYHPNHGTRQAFREAAE